MKRVFYLFTAMVMLALCGCSARYIDVGGEKYEMISESEEQELVERARLAVSRINSRLKQYERQAVMEKAPEMRFFYSGNRYGRAVVRWVLPEREIGVNYDGEFMSDHMSCRVYSRDAVPEKIDYTKQLPANRAGRKNINKKQRIK